MMQIGIPAERRLGETRVAATPETVKKYIALGFDVLVETGAGLGSSIPDKDYVATGAKIAKKPEDVYKCPIVLKVQAPLLKGEGRLDEGSLLQKGQLLIGLLSPATSPDHVAAYKKAGVTAVSLELIPRITRAQSMDVLSSQSNLAGYRAVIEAAATYGRAFPMMMTAAGTVFPAKVLVLGAGVAGLQAIATARRLGAVVSAFDVRPVAKEQVESLGATFIEVAAQGAETAGGYAKEMDADYKKKQAALIHETLKKTDVVITTALIPGRQAPRLITEEMLQDMRAGSVVVDLAVESGGNCAGSQAGKIVDVGGVKIVGHINMAGRMAADASPLFARNIFSLMQLIYNDASKSIQLDFKDEIINASVITHAGEQRYDVEPAPKAGAKKAAPRKEIKKATPAKKEVKKVGETKIDTKKQVAKKAAAKKPVAKKGEKK